MEPTFGSVFEAGGSFHTVAIRSPGLLVRPSDGVIGEAGDPDALPLAPSAGDVTHALTIPAGALAIEVTRGPDKHFVVRLSRGTLLNIQPVVARVNVTRVQADREAENTTRTRSGLSNLTVLDAARRSVDALASPSACVDVSGPRVALVGAYPGVLGIRVFPYIIKLDLGSMEAEFAVVQAFVLPAGTRGVVDVGRTVALVGGEPLVMTELPIDVVRHSIDQLLREPMRDAPPEIASVWEQAMPPVIDDFTKILAHVGPVHSAWSARAAQEAWRLLDEAWRTRASAAG